MSATINPDHLALYFVSYTDEDGDSLNGFCTARNPEEAFALWRRGYELDPETYIEIESDHIARVIEVPAKGDEPGEMNWPKETHYYLSHVSLTTQAIELTDDTPSPHQQ